MEREEKTLIMLAIKMLDKQDGLEIEIYEYLEQHLKNNGSWAVTDLLKNVTVIEGVAFLNEDWVEANYGKYE